MNVAIIHIHGYIHSLCLEHVKALTTKTKLSIPVIKRVFFFLIICMVSISWQIQGLN